MTQHAERSEVPPDFPRLGETALSGGHPKIGVRLLAGQFLGGDTGDELSARYEAYLDLVEQLTAYALRKQAERSDVPVGVLLRGVRAAVVQKGWNLDASELRWVMNKVAVGMGTAAPPDLNMVEIPSSVLFSHPSAPPHIESIVDRARSRLEIQNAPFSPHTMTKISTAEHFESMKTSQHYRDFERPVLNISAFPRKGGGWETLVAVEHVDGTRQDESGTTFQDGLAGILARVMDDVETLHAANPATPSPASNELWVKVSTEARAAK